MDVVDKTRTDTERNSKAANKKNSTNKKNSKSEAPQLENEDSVSSSASSKKSSSSSSSSTTVNSKSQKSSCSSSSKKNNNKTTRSKSKSTDIEKNENETTENGTCTENNGNESNNLEIPAKDNEPVEEKLKDKEENNTTENKENTENIQNSVEPEPAPEIKREFKLRVVPLEKLLARPPPPPTPVKNISIIELSDSDESEKNKKKTQKRKEKQQERKQKQKRRKQKYSDSESEGDSEEEIIIKRDRRRGRDNFVATSNSHKSGRSSPVVEPTKTTTETAKRERLVTTIRLTNSSTTTTTAAATTSTTKSAPISDSHKNTQVQQFKLKNLRVRVKRVAWPGVVQKEKPKRKASNPSSDSEVQAPTTSAKAAAAAAEKSKSQNSSNKRKAQERKAKKRPTLIDSDSETNGDSDFDMNQVKAKIKKVSSDGSDGQDYDPAADGMQNGDSDNNEDRGDEDDASDLSEVLPTRKRRVFTEKKKSESDGSSSKSSADDSSDFEPDAKQKKKRRRIKTNSSDDSDDDDEDGDGKKKKRKHIRKIIKTKDLDMSTKEAAKEEEDRRKRIEERQKVYNQIYEKPDSVEVSELVLDFDEETKEPLLEVDKGLLKKLKPHQVTGVKFMWDACFETLKDASEKPGSGCILAHCMGLGKTLQIVALTHTLLIQSRKTNVERVLIISPLSTLTNWAREYKYWMSFARKKNIEITDMSKYRDKATRIFKINEWFEEGGVLIVGYDMYRILANEKAKGLRKKQREQLQRGLVDPGPDLVVCDEGHLLKNEKTSLSKAVTKMRTRRRIVLTGTPLQNNLKEYYCMIQFIKPNLLGTYKEYMNRFVNPITNGQYTDSTDRDIRLMKHRSHILHKLLEGCIQRRDYSVLAPYLPPKYEYVVYTTLSELQQQLYEYYMEVQRDQSGNQLISKGARLFQDFQDLRRIWTHPMNLRVNSDNVIRKRLLQDNDDSLDDFICDDDEDDDANSTSSNGDSSKSFASGGSGGGGGGGKGVPKGRKTRNTRNMNGDDSDLEELPNGPLVEKDDPSEWWKRFVDEQSLNKIYHSPKLVILMRLLEQCEAIGDKLLVFSQSLQSLDVIEHFLKLIDQKTKGQEYEGDVGEFKGFWTPGLDYFRLDGSCSVESREAMCKKFNDTTNLRARLFLISTRAGGLGINLVAANRVVIYDVSWNPSHDTQSIFRVYRFGQDKPCYIYRLISMGTMEQKVYERQVTKQATAKRVIDEQQITRHYNSSDIQELYSYELKPAVKREIPILPKDRLFAELLTEHEDLLYKYHEHDSLLENEESEHLNEAERKAAWDEYEAEKTRTVQTAQYVSYDRGAYGGAFGNPSGSATTNKIFGFRSDVLLQLLNMKITQDLPELNHNQVVQMVPTYLQRLYQEMNNGDPTMYKDLLALHSTLARPGGHYMSPLLFANQEVGNAGYYQAQQPMGGLPQHMVPPPHPMAPPPRPAPGFEPNMVYELD